MYALDGLSGADRRKFHTALGTSHSIRIQVSVMTLDGDRLSHLTPVIMDGQVNVDATDSTKVTRSATLTLYDPRRSLNLDSNSPSDGALYLDRQIRIRYGVKVPTVGWVDVPVMTGPVTYVQRDDVFLNIEIQGRETLAMGALWKPLTIRKGASKVYAIRTIMQRCGETNFDLPDIAEKLPKHLSLGRETVPWEAAQKIARSLNRQLYYDGAGVCRLRRLPNNPLFTFREGNGGTITEAPTISFDSAAVKNVVLVKGGKPKGVQYNPPGDDTPAVGAEIVGPGYRGIAVAPRSHPMSPWNLGSNSQPRYLLDVIDDSHLRSQSAVNQLANQRLSDHLRQEVAIDWTSFAVPHLDPLDWVRVKTDEFSRGQRLKRYSLPLTLSGLMSCGRTSKVSVSRRGHR